MNEKKLWFIFENKRQEIKITNLRLASWQFGSSCFLPRPLLVVPVQEEEWERHDKKEEKDVDPDGGIPLNRFPELFIAVLENNHNTIAI